MEAEHGNLFVGEWIPENVARLMVHIRHHGVTVFEVSGAGELAVAVRFEPNLGQTVMVETLLLAWPGVSRVEHVRAGLTLAHGRPIVPTPDHTSRRLSRLRSHRRPS
jgi:hypothetical protein